MIAFDLADFAAAVQERGAGWDAAGIQWWFTFGPTQSKSSACVDCETTEALAQLIVWTSGGADLEIGDVATGAVRITQYHLAARRISRPASTNSPKG